MSEKIRILVVNDSEESLATIKKLLELSNEFKLIGEAKNGSQALTLANQYQPDIIIMDITMPIMDGFTASMKITEVAPYIGIILVGPAESVSVIRRAMQSGAGDFLELPLNSGKLNKSILKLYANKQSQKKQLLNNPLIVPRRQPKIISVFSSKGGVGKSVIATNLAVALKKVTREDVLLMDLDLQFGDVADLLNVKSKVSIIDLLSDMDEIEINEYGKYFSSHHSGVKILSAPEKPEQADLVAEDNIKILLELFRKSFDYIVIDLPPLFNNVTLGCIETSDQLVLISTMEIPTLKNIKSGLQILKKIGYPEEKIVLVLNRYHNNREIKLADIKKFFVNEDIVCIEDSPDFVSKSINVGEPVVLNFKESTVAKQIIQLSKRLIDYEGLKKQQAEKRSFVEKLFGKRR